MSRKEIIGLFVAGIIFAIVLAVILRLKLVDTAQAIQIIITFVLVLVTVAYVKRTADIAKATKQQADASVRMAEEMKKQRYTESLPLLVPSIIPTLRELADNEFVAYETLVSGNGMKVRWCNVGKGVAINARFCFYAAPHPSGQADYFPIRESGTLLEVGGKEEVDYSRMLDDSISLEVINGYKPRLEAEYLDIYERNIATVQEFQVDEENRGTSLGELYFKINGKRLGEEGS